MNKNNIKKIVLSPSFALVLAVFLGILLPDGAGYFAWIGTVFISLLKLLVLPIVFVSCFYALTRNTLKESSSLAGRTLLFYLTTSAMAALVGIIFAFIFLNGNVDPGNLPQVKSINANFSLELFIKRFIPLNIFRSLAEGNILHVLFMAFFAGIAVHYIPTKAQIVSLAQSLNDLLMKMLSFVIKLSPVGIIGLVYPAVAGLDSSSLFALGSFSIAVILASSVHSMLTLPIILKVFSGRNTLSFFLSVRSALTVALSTASSSATYPVSKDVLEKNEKVSTKITGFSLPLGATLNMDGSAIYQSILLIFISFLAGVTPSFWQVIMIFTLTMLSSAGTAGVPGGGIAMMAFMLQLLGLPSAYLGLYLLVDRFFDYPITAINVWGDLIVARSLQGRNA